MILLPFISPLLHHNFIFLVLILLRHFIMLNNKHLIISIFYHHKFLPLLYGQEEMENYLFILLIQFLIFIHLRFFLILLLMVSNMLRLMMVKYILEMLFLLRISFQHRFLRFLLIFYYYPINIIQQCLHLQHISLSIL